MNLHSIDGNKTCFCWSTTMRRTRGFAKTKWDVKVFLDGLMVSNVCLKSIVDSCKNIE